MSARTAPAPAAGVARKPRVAASERALVLTCILVPLAGLVLFFGYPLFMVALKSLTQADGSIGFGNYLRVLASPGILTAVQNSSGHGDDDDGGVDRLRLCHRLSSGAHRRSHQTDRPGGADPAAPGAVAGAGAGPDLSAGAQRDRQQPDRLGIEIYGLPGLVIANSIYAVPRAVLIIRAALRQSDARHYEAAMMLGASRWQQFRDITVPNSKFGVLSAGFVIFTLSITDFGNAAVIGGGYNVLATEIYAQVVGQMNFGMGAVVGMLLLLPTVVAVYIERVAAQQQFGGTSESSIPVEPERVPPPRLAPRLVRLGVLRQRPAGGRNRRLCQFRETLALRPVVDAGQLQRQGQRRLRPLVDILSGVVHRRRPRCRLPVLPGLRSGLYRPRLWPSSSTCWRFCRSGRRVLSWGFPTCWRSTCRTRCWDCSTAAHC
ncbi:MAG: ABC transporter permease subunit [Roseovarius sp.]|nr:ABC transporter permease subunit [Roseovarius sp.]